MDTRLLDILVCPLCKSGLEYDKAAQELICHADKLAYPIRDGIPIMWADQARSLQAGGNGAPPKADAADAADAAGGAGGAGAAGIPGAGSDAA